MKRNNFLTLPTFGATPVVPKPETTNHPEYSMKLEPSYPTHRAKRSLAVCLAALFTLSATATWAADDASKLADENAALRKQLAELQARNGGTAASPAAAPAADEGVTVLSPYTVTDEKDNGYLRTNSVTATRINMPIQNVPMSISVMSKDFIDDANIRSITDVLRYSSSGAGDNSFAMKRPANSATPQGNFTLRGFGVNSLLRNGISRYIGYNVNNVDRIEVVKGPASVFFGAGYPGGVINYITKQPVFAKIPTTIQYVFGDNNLNRVIVDNNTELSKKAAMRIVGSWENSSGARNFEFNKTNSITANIALNPFDSGKLKVTFEIEHYESNFNVNQGDWIYPSGWFAAYQAPSAALIAASGVADANAYKTRIFNSLGNYMADVRKAANDYSIATYTSVQRGAYYQDRNNNRIHDEGFNYSDRGDVSKNYVDTPSATVEFSPFSFLDGRYVVTNETARFDNVEGILNPYADGRLFNALNGNNTSGYYRAYQNHQVDLIFKYDRWGIKSKLLVGGTFTKQNQQYQAADSVGAQGIPNYSKIPGITNPAGNPGLTQVGTTNQWTGQFGTGSTADVPVNQVIKDRYGVIKTVQQVFTQYDPGWDIKPDISTTMLYNRTALDGYKTEDQAGYLNYNGTLLDDRLTVLAGVRREMHRDSGQYLTHNFPWFSPPNYAFKDTVTYPPTAYGYDYGYAGDSNGFQRQAGSSWMAGLSYAVTKEINVYTSYSSVFRLNSGTAAGLSQLTLPDVYNAAKAWAQNTANTSTYNASGTFTYDGKSISTYQQFYDALNAKGAFDIIKNEKGYNAEVGVKTALWDNKLTGTFALFQSERSNQKLDDTARQGTEALNGSNNVVIFGPAGQPYSGSRVARWRTVGVKNQIQGADFEFIWTPQRNFQSLINGSWMWKAKTVDNPTVAKPGSATYATYTGVTKVNADLQYGERLENVPEYTLNLINKYTFTDNTFAGLSIGVNARYKSTTLISRSVDWNPRTGGLTSGNFTVFDVNVGYPWEVFGYKISTQAGVYNVFDKLYIEGATQITSPGRTWLVSNTLKF